LAPGELALAKASVSLAPASATVLNANASESKRAPALPTELNGVSVAINGAACGLFAVGSSQIKFVVPKGLGAGTYAIVINNNGTVIRGVLTILSAQPDIFTSTNGPAGRAKVCNVTNANTPSTTCIAEPFNVTTDDGTGNQVSTILRVFLTGVRATLAGGINVTIGTTVIVPTQNVPDDLPGTDKVDFTLPSTVDSGDQPIVVSVGLASSRTVNTDPPHVTINAPPATPTPTPTPSPISNPDAFVRQQYLDFLNREPDASGLAFWTNQITACGGDQQCIGAQRVNVSAAFFLSTEFQQTGYLVYRTYKAAYGNISNAPVPLTFGEFLPDTQQIGQGVVVGQTGWEQVLETNKQSFMTAFVQRQRFTSAYPMSLSAQQFVDKLYTNAGVTPTSTKAIKEFSSTTSSDPQERARALRDVAEDTMLVQQEFNRAFVLMEYFGYLRRNPNDVPDSDFTGYNFWLAKLNQFNGNYVAAEMVKSFITSSEYLKRFGQ